MVGSTASKAVPSCCRRVSVMPNAVMCCLISAAAAAGQDQEHRRRSIAPPLLLRIGAQLSDLLGQGMADIAAGRPVQLLVRLRLERRQRHHMIDIGLHRAPGPPPRPNRRRDIIDDRIRGAFTRTRLATRWGEVGAVDDDQDDRARRR
jgi:hypothetical protein